MTNYNYLISLRKDVDGGVPGPDISDAKQTTTYIRLDDQKPSYLLTGDDVVPTPTTWAEQVKAAANGGPVIVFVHGYNNSATKLVETHNKLNRELAIALGGRPFCLVSFDWPTDDKGDTYFHDRRNAEASAPHLRPDCLDPLAGLDVHLLGHSMGAYVIQLACSEPASWQINHLILAAADVKASDLATSADSLTHLLTHCTDLTCYYSADDKALAVSALIPGHGPRLGRTGFTQSTTDREPQCVNIKCTPYYEANIKPDDGSALTSHVWYLDCADFIADLTHIITEAPSFPNRSPDPSSNKNWYDLVSYPGLKPGASWADPLTGIISPQASTGHCV
ncbi:MAG: alpha/beta fold hydrolase [Chloroflexi bacterium]|nr:alpha/beta fold hydrolase [Chloroflexota bacterium]MBU1751312.1 alpha/beta fold hydrolase [Chloroflexota bacterium]MBU1877629.1 alpha/beta fold hydrolase [Chloroflexota bacterium]